MSELTTRLLADFHRRSRTGASSSPISPYRCQPTAASQVRGATTGDRVGSTGIRLPQPLNQTADEQGSSPRMPGRCFREFIST